MRLALATQESEPYLLAEFGQAPIGIGKLYVCGPRDPSFRFALRKSGRFGAVRSHLAGSPQQKENHAQAEESPGYIPATANKLK